MKRFSSLQEDLRDWFSKTSPHGDWKRINSKGEAIGPCAREPGEPKPKCMSAAKRASLSKKERAAAVRAKREHDPNPERKGKPINVSNYGKGKISENMENLQEKNAPTNPELWSRAKALARSKFDVYPSAYANGWASKWYKSKGGSWKTVSEAVKDKYDEGEYDQEGDMAKSDLRSIIANAKELHDMIDDADNLPEWCQNKITLAEDYISTVANYMTAEMNESSSARVRLAMAMKRAQEQREREERAGAALLKPKPVKEDVIQEGRPSQRHPLEGHEYHKKTNDELVHIAKDAHAAAEAMKSHNTTAENKYRDQANDSATVRHFRKTSGMPDWYKKKYGHMKEEVVNEVMDEPNYKNSIQARQKMAESLAKQFEIIYREQNGDRKRKIVSGTSKEAVARQFKKQYKLEIEQVKQLQQGVAESSVGDKIKGAAKSIKRAVQWDSGPEMVTPAGTVKAFKDMDGQHLANFVASRKELPAAKKGSARAFADKVIDREMRQRGYGRVANKNEQGVAEGTDSYTVANDPDKPGMHSYREVGHALQSGHSDAAKIYKNNKFLSTVGDVRKQGNKPPFDGPYKKTPTVVTDKSGARHGPMSRVRDLARNAAKKQAQKMPVKEGLEESRKAEIVKEIMKKGKKKDDNSFQSEPELGTTVVKADN